MEDKTCQCAKRAFKSFSYCGACLVPSTKSPRDSTSDPSTNLTDFRRLPYGCLRTILILWQAHLRNSQLLKMANHSYELAQSDRKGKRRLRIQPKPKRQFCRAILQSPYCQYLCFLPLYLRLLKLYCTVWYKTTSFAGCKDVGLHFICHPRMRQELSRLDPFVLAIPIRLISI